MGKMLAGKRGLIMGVANERSIAWGIAKAVAGEGAELAFSYQGEAFGKRVEPLAASVGSDILIDLDVTRNRPDCWGYVGIARDIAARMVVGSTSMDQLVWVIADWQSLICRREAVNPCQMDKIPVGIDPGRCRYFGAAAGNPGSWRCSEPAAGKFPAASTG